MAKVTRILALLTIVALVAALPMSAGKVEYSYTISQCPIPTPRKRTAYAPKVSPAPRLGGPVAGALAVSGPVVGGPAGCFSLYGPYGPDRSDPFVRELYTCVPKCHRRKQSNDRKGGTKLTRTIQINCRLMLSSLQR